MKQANIAHLQAEWDGLMKLWAVDEALAREAFADLVAHYGENGRYYHTLSHIQNVLNVIQKLGHHAHDLPAVQLAAWFHDVIYDPRADDNEEQSAQYAAQVLRRLQIPPAVIANVQRMIRATTHKNPFPQDIDCQILLDADLATFASDWPLQEWIEQAIRREYAFVPEAVYREGRRQILRQFLGRQRIYLTEPMFNAQEAQARRNIARAIENLKK